mgnify:CR=1 FL=1
MSSELTPSELRELIYNGKLDQQTLDKLPKEAWTLLITRPNERELDGAKNGMVFRSVLIFLSAVYFISYPDTGEIWVIFLALACYEMAYYEIRKEVCHDGHYSALLEYSERVDDYIKSHYPNQEQLRSEYRTPEYDLSPEAITQDPEYLASASKYYTLKEYDQPTSIAPIQLEYANITARADIKCPACGIELRKPEQVRDFSMGMLFECPACKQRITA